MKLLRLLITLVLCVASTVGAMAARGWEEVERLPVGVAEQRGGGDADYSGELTTAVAEGYLYVMVQQRTTVRLFTILGQQIASETLAPGVYRFKLTAKGIYLLRAGAQTRRVTI